MRWSWLIKKFAVILLALVALISASSAQYNTPTQINPNNPNGPGQEDMPDGMFAAATNTGTDNAPTATRPEAGAQPQTPPEASTGETASELEQGQPLTREQVSSFGQVEETGTAMATGLVGGTAPAGLQYRVLYDGYWSYGPAAVYSDQQINMLVSIDQPQTIWSYEEYPGGHEVWTEWGYWYPGDYNTWFYGDAEGWHLVAIYGENSGWSNGVWIYVEPGSPYMANGISQPIGSSSQGPDFDEGEAPAPGSGVGEAQGSDVDDVGEIQP
jgi:hypothetical protein